MPEAYIVWFAQQGFPKGELGNMLECVYEIKLNGLEYLLNPLR
ncbi:MAG TPA: putative quorum-sensing-regulated virulence factor [Candidatus Wunengus sp. YC63]